MAGSIVNLMLVVLLLVLSATINEQTDESAFTNSSATETSTAETSSVNISQTMSNAADTSRLTTTGNQSNQKKTSDVHNVELNTVNTTGGETGWVQGSDSTSYPDHWTQESGSSSNPIQWEQQSDSSSRPVQQVTDAGVFSFPLPLSFISARSNTECNVTEWMMDGDYHLNVIKPVTNITTAVSTVTMCEVPIRVPEDNIIHAFFEDILIPPSAGCEVQVSLCWADGSCRVRKTISNTFQPCCRDFYLFKQENITMDITAFSCSFFEIRFRFRAVPYELRYALPVMNTSASSGYVTTPGFDDNKNYPLGTWASFELNITQEEIILISFPHFDLENHTSCRYDSLKLYTVNESDVSLVETWCGFRDIPTTVFYSSIQLKFVSDIVVQNTGFKMMYTVLLKSQEPRKIGDDLFDCSVPHFPEFAHHLNCNLAVNCEGQEDEMHCDYTSKECGPGRIDAGDKCYIYSRLQRGLSWYEAYSYCLANNQSLVSPSNPREWKRFLDIIPYGRKVSTVYTGLRNAQANTAAVPSLYQSMWQWADKTIGLYVHLDVQRNSVPACTKFVPHFSADRMQTASCVQPLDARYVCEAWKSSVSLSPDSLVMPTLGSNYTWPKNVSVLPCPSGHVVRDFLWCDLQSYCQEDRYASPCSVQGSIPLFQCDHSSQSIHYTLVCDFRLDCSDGSDESWCFTGQCPEDSCRSGQCISNDDRCDGMQHCVDASDENCPQIIRTGPVPVAPPVLVNFDGRGQYWVQPMNQSDPCPQTHFKCADSYCLPLYLRCNGMEDCPGHEDEAACEVYTCPGLFRCRASRVCLHPDHVCDGVAHCPQHDDERLCDLTCPDACQCEGLAFVCAHKIPASSFPSLRYLDVSRSAMILSDLKQNFYLAHLRMSWCGLKNLESIALPGSQLVLPNLRTLDLSYNSLTSLSLDSLLGFTNLRVLILTGNPLVDLVPAKSSAKHETFRSLTLSQTQLTTVNGSVFQNFPAMKELNLSTEWLASITGGFTSTPSLEVLDLRGSYDLTYPSDMLKGLASLRLLYANDFKLCCRTALPENFDQENCFAPSDDIASCEDLLRSDVYRVFLWMFALLAVLGNVGSFVARLYLQDKSYQSRGQSNFNVLVTNLSVADFLMGVYLTIIGVADYIYRGQYVWYVETWKKSMACQAAGFLSFASSEVSAFFICLITLDRFLILRFPFRKLRFRRKSVLVASAIAWILGFALAAVPFLPMSPPWEFYSQTGICIPLPFTDKDRFQGYTYSFSVMMVLNLVLFVLIAVGQGFIYSTVRASSMVPAKKKASRDSAIARRLTTIVLSDFLCWFPVGLLGVLASVGVSIPVDIRVGVAIFVLPFNSALNPFLYTFNIVMEKRRKAAEARMLERLESRHFTELSRMEARLPVQLTVTKETALNQIEGWLGVRVLTMSDLASRFDMMPRMIDTTSSSHPQ